MNRICIIVFYFGEMPWYHSLFMESCMRNKSFDFLFLSDCFSSVKQYNNITEQPFTISEFNGLASNKLGFDVSVKNGLKMCDFRPAFGHLFSEYLKNYEFWGYSDTDIVLGNLGNFITDKILSNYDFISVRKEYPSGFFAVYRNENFINKLFCQSESYKEHFVKDENTLFEECGGYYYHLIKLKMNILDTECPYDTFHHLLERNKNQVRSYYENLSVDEVEKKITLIGNQLFYNNKEIIMYHLTNFKKNYFVKKPNCKISDSDLYFFRYSIRKKSPINFIVGQCNDIFKVLYMSLSTFIDSKLKRSVKVFDVRGNYRYMQGIAEFTELEGQPVISYDGFMFSVVRSLFERKKFYICDVNAYLEINNENLLTVIFFNGDKIILTKEEVPA
ncbi:DUF6625 family protein [Flavobacterium tructae]|uniref:DUF6625 family protein n=1 Tax=Flavobacterium tructae TaxID=1114873 RepID=UPI0035A8F3A4